MLLKGVPREKGISLETTTLVSTRHCTSTGNEFVVFPLLLNRVSLPEIYFVVLSSGKMSVNLKTGDLLWIGGFGLSDLVCFDSYHDYFYTLCDYWSYNGFLVLKSLALCYLWLPSLTPELQHGDVKEAGKKKYSKSGIWKVYNFFLLKTLKCAPYIAFPTPNNCNHYLDK